MISRTGATTKTILECLHSYGKKTCMNAMIDNVQLIPKSTRIFWRDQIYKFSWDNKNLDKLEVEPYR